MATKSQDDTVNLEVTKLVDENQSPETDGKEPKPKRGRGRPVGSTSKTAAKSTAKKSDSKKATDIEDFAKQICGVHQMVALFTGIKEAAITPDEATMLAKGINSVCEEYGLELDGKTGAAIQLFGAAAMVYAPRVIGFKVRMAQEAAQRQNNGLENGSENESNNQAG